MSDDLRSKGVQNQVTGAAKEAEGKVRDAAADITGDDSENLKAKAKTLEGKVQKNSKTPTTQSSSTTTTPDVEAGSW